MNDSLAVLLLPLIPMTLAVLAILVRQVFSRDVSTAAIRLAMLGMIAIGGYLAWRFWSEPQTLYVPLSLWDYHTVLSFDRIKVRFVITLLTPALLSFGYQHLLPNPYLRIVFLFYLTGCAGLTVTGDVFTFFIFYEMMIMAAYVLITVRTRFYAGIKYMVVGSVSSSFLLAGIILLYATAGTFHFGFVDQVHQLAVGNIKFLMLLFSMAFFVKSAFFPASSWAATCHSATNPLISAFLSSFTIFTGVYGLIFLVLEPAHELGYTPIFEFLRLVSILTVSLPALFVFFEPDLKRCVAGSTVFSIGFIGILLSYRLTEYALAYMMIHAMYKSVMFLLLDRVEVRGLDVYGRRSTLALYLPAIFFTTGFFPSLVYFLKSAFIRENPLYRLLVYSSMFLVFGSFFKFRYHRAGPDRAEATPPAPWIFTIILGMLFLAHVLLFPFYRWPSWASTGVDVLFLAGALFLSRALYRTATLLHALDTRYVFRNLNAELLLIMVLFFTEIALLRYLLP